MNRYSNCSSIVPAAWSVSALFALSCLLPVVAQAQASFEVLPFSPTLFFPPGDAVLSLSADGRTSVGMVVTSARPGGPRAAARWDEGLGLTELPGIVTDPLFVEDNAFAYGISADGSTSVGTVSNLALRDAAAVWRADGSLTLITAGLTGPHAKAVDVSGDGTVVLGQDSPFSPGGEALGGFVWDEANGARGIKALTGYAGTLVATAISDNGLTVTGLVEDSTFAPTETFRWTEAGGLERLGFVEGDDSSRAYAISGDGSTIVGSSWSSGSSRVEAFRWTEAGGMEGLGQLDYRLPGTSLVRTTTRSRAFGASQDGSVIVGGSEHAWIYSEQYGGMVEIRELLIRLGVVGLDGWRLFEAVDVSADGRVITGWGNNFSMGLQDIAWRAVIPEPSSALLLGLGLLALAKKRTA